jgi:hypothetical protein
MKLFIRKINDCLSCPSCGTDQNITRYECGKKRNKFIVWDNGQNNIKIPEWCPLPDNDILTEKDFEIE